MKTACVRLDGEGLRFDARSGSGHALTLDGVEGDSGPRPTELVLMALAGCAAMDVVSILRKKRQPVEGYEVSVHGMQRVDHPRAFTEIEVLHLVRGPVDPEAVRRSVELSATRYCAVGAALSSGMARMRHAFQVDRPDGVVVGEVCVTGPHRTIDEPVPA
jgi:putative redox protein